MIAKLLILFFWPWVNLQHAEIVTTCRVERCQRNCEIELHVRTAAALTKLSEEILR